MVYFKKEGGRDAWRWTGNADIEVPIELCGCLDDGTFASLGAMLCDLVGGEADNQPKAEYL